MKEKKRLDVLLMDLGLLESREKAKAVIMAGQVYVDHQKADKPGAAYPTTVQVEMRGPAMPYVSRGGLKLKKAMDSFGLCLGGKTAMDIGASTGGFTDCMLQNGAVKVYSVDVGYGQLAWKLRIDPRVVNLERTNIRHIKREQVPDPIGFVSVDVSFISLKLVLPVARELMAEDAEAVCLIKPQFEAGRENVGKRGVVRDPKVHVQVIQNVVSFVAAIGFAVLGLTFSPVKGPEGNIEYLLYIKKGKDTRSESAIDIVGLVEQSHAQLDVH